jgi:hypothetical protein
MSANQHPPTPTLDKVSEVSDRSQTAGDFVRWLQDEKHLVLCQSMVIDEQYGTTRFVPMAPRDSALDRLLYEYFGLDYDAAEKERLGLLQWMRDRAAQS